MDISITCETFARFAALAMTAPDASLQAVRVEVRDGRAFVIATNRQGAAVQYIGGDLGPDIQFTVPITETILAGVSKEAQFSSNVRIMKGLLITDFAFFEQYVEPIETELENWRKWFPDALPTETTAPVFQSLENFKALTAASPSGSVVFQKYISADQPVLFWDVHNVNFVGIFMVDKNGQDIPEFQFPEWLK